MDFSSFGGTSAWYGGFSSSTCYWDFLASIAPGIVLHSSLGRSLYAGELSRRFDATVFIELLSKPEVSPAPWVAGSVVVGVIFLFYMIFLSGGILAVYRETASSLAASSSNPAAIFSGEWCACCSAPSFRSGIVFALLLWVGSVSGKMASNAPREMQGFWVQVVGTLLCLVLVLFVRAWFDLAQARTVVDRVRGMFKLSLRSFVLALRNLPRLLSIYLATTLVLRACGHSRLGTVAEHSTQIFWPKLAALGSCHSGDGRHPAMATRGNRVLVRKLR